MELVFSADGSVWIGGIDALAQVRLNGFLPDSATVLQKMNYPTGKACTNFLKLSSYADGSVIGTYEDRERSLLLEWNSGEWRTLFETEPYEGLRGWRDSSKTLWIYDQVNGLIRRNAGGRETAFHDSAFLSGEINDFALGDDDSFWLATENGIVRHAEFLWQQPDGLTENPYDCHCIIEDDSGRIWFACLDRLLKYEDGQWENYAIPRDLEVYQSTTSPLSTTPRGTLIVFTNQDSFLEFDPDRNTFQPFDMPDKNGYFIMKQAGRDRIYVLANVKNEKFTIQKIINQSVVFVKEFDLSSLPKENLIQNIYLRDYVEMPDDRKYFLSLSGIFEYSNNRFKLAGPMKSAMCALQRNDGSVWFGSNEEIAALEDDRWYFVRKPINYVRSLIESRDGGVWAATKDGVSRFFHKGWIDYTSEDGLPDSPVNIVFEDSQNRIWAGTNNGIFVFHPEADPDAPDTLLSPDKNISEISPSGNLQILYSGIDRWKYTHSDRLLYSHCFDREAWSPFTHGTVLMATGIPYGEHRFEVRAMDAAGNIDSTPAVFEFTVMHPWYQHLPVQIVACLGIAIIVWLIERWYKAIRKLQTLATTDGLTQLCNRRYFWELAAKEWERALRYEHDLSLIVADIDFFKSVNDRYGHHFGDRVLQAVSSIIARSVRNTDIAGRIGGEEFAILLPDTSRKDALITAERIRTLISNKPFEINGINIPVTISLGISTNPSEGRKLGDFFTAADTALYQAKNEGRNRTVVSECEFQTIRS